MKRPVETRRVLPAGNLAAQDALDDGNAYGSLTKSAAMK